MVERLDAPQPTIPLPPIEQIPDDDTDKPKPGIQIMTRIGDHPAIVFGTATFSRIYSTEDQFQGVTPLRVTRLALRYGINAFDTAPYYGPSEIILGNALKALSCEFPRSSYQLLTKCGRFGNTRADFDLTRQGVHASVSRSLARLHTDYLDTVYVHDLEFIAETRAPRTAGLHLSALDSERDAYGLGEDQAGQVLGDGDKEVLGAVAALRELQDKGIVRRVGISGYPLPTLLRLAILVLHETGKPLDVVMSYCHLNLQNRTLEAFRPAFLERAKVTRVVAASPLCMGLLSPKPPVWHPSSDKTKAAVANAVALHNQRIDGEENGPTFSELALGYAFERALEAQIPTVAGLCHVEEVHTCARIWHELESGKARSEWGNHVEAVISSLKDADVLDQSWENPRFA
ncbi:Aldo/keto reductase family-domain-containing protein [Scleroderma yunnanense]